MIARVMVDDLNGYLMPRAKPGGRQRTVDMRDVINIILSLLCTGGPWDMLPHDLLPREHSLCRLLAVVHRLHVAPPDGHAPSRRPPAAGTLARAGHRCHLNRQPMVQTMEQGGDRARMAARKSGIDHGVGYPQQLLCGTKYFSTGARGMQGFNFEPGAADTVPRLSRVYPSG